MTDPTLSTSPPKFFVRLATGAQYGPAPMDLVREWACQGRIPRDSTIVAADGGSPRSVLEVPEVAAVLGAPPTAPTAVVPVAPKSDATGGIIPYKNMPGLVGYYIAVFAIIPVLALILGPIAFVLGIMGLRLASRKAEARGRAHAWIAIIGGAVLFLANAGVILIISVARANAW